MNKKMCVVFHNCDLDGWMSAAIVKHWWQTDQRVQQDFEIATGKVVDGSEDKIDFIGYNYGDPIPDLSEYDKVIMCDISFPAMEMINMDDKIIWIDHHISAINDVNRAIENNETLGAKQLDGIRDTKFAACELTWQYFMSNPIEKFGEMEDENPMPEIVRLLGLYDSFRHKGTDEEQKVLEFQYGARQCISNYEEAYNWLQDDILHSLTTINRILTKGRTIYQYLYTEAKQVYKNGFPIYFGIPGNEVKGWLGGKYRFICINRERFNPINFGIDYHADGYDGCACFYFTGKDWSFSLYNDNGLVDCSIIAKQFGGGGHKGASGFRVNDINSIIKTNE
jgi:oligoribonuclease NrnB/cAMP/cGMP phosphodiesterase (DHH superfamily)